MAFIVIDVGFGIATAMIGRAKGSSFFIWLLIGLALNVFGLIAVILYHGERDEPERRCPRCGKILKLYVQVCTRCGADLSMPEPEEIHRPAQNPAR